MEIFDGRYEQEKLLGQGAFSEVWKVKDTQTGVALALKIYNPTTGMDESGNEMLTHEFALMVNANHKNLLRPLFFATCDKRPYLILPYCEKGNIGKMIGKMSEEEAWKLIRDCASALDYLHAMNPPILHQDIKPANILLSDNGDYMLTDFGVSTQAKQSMSRVSNQEKELLSAGTISYMAPERFSRNNLPIMANDIYSLGSTVFEMLSGELPFGNDGGLLQKKGAEIPELPGNFSPLLKRTLEKCLEEEPWARPTAGRLEDIANEALKHPETRNQIPAIFSATSPSEVPQSQLNAATAPNAKGTVIGPAAIEAAMKGTVMGNASGNPYTSNSIQPSGSSKKGLWIGIAVAVILAIGAGAFFLFGPMSENSQDTELAVDPAEQQKMQEQAEYEAALALFNQESPDSIQVAFNRMKVLADNGNKDAIFEVAKTYAWIPNDIESDRRKRLMGWEITEEGALKGAPVADAINRDAINWLQKSIDMQVPNFHQSLYWLSFYYYYGLGTNEDTKKTISLLEQAKNEAEKSQDFVFKEKIEKTLEQLN
ncbi:MAG: protein kinase [Prevotella sp.]|nr:protein kinase [Prevotella sp.]